MKIQRESHSGRFVAVLTAKTELLRLHKLYYGPMLQGLSEVLLDKGLCIRPVQCAHEYQRQDFLNHAPDVYAGIVFLGDIYQFEPFVKTVAGQFDGPKLVLDHHFPDLPIHSVREDSAAGMRVLTEHLLGLGHEHIAYLDSDRPEDNPWKREGVNQALREAGRPELGPGWTASCRRIFSDAATALDWFLSMDPRPTAIIGSDDNRALLLLQAAAEQGLRVPGDLSIAGFGDSAVRGGRSQKLTSTSLDPAVLGRKAAELLTAPEQKAVSVLVPLELEARGTTGAPPGK